MGQQEPEKIIFSMSRVRKHYNHETVLKDISLSYFYGAKIGVVGLNGSGKSSLLRIMAGVDNDYEGEAALSAGYTVGYLEQEPQLDDTKTVNEIVSEGARETIELLEEFDRINEKFAQPMDDDQMQKLLDRQSKVQEKLDSADAWEINSKLEMAMDALRCPAQDTPVKVISGGERRRVALCRLLIQKPDILLLDEPTNHLDAETLAWLENHLRNYHGTVIAVTHDRYFLNNIAGWILELDKGEGVPWRGNYSSWLEQKKKRLENTKKTDRKMSRTLMHELEWIGMSSRDRHNLSKSKIKNYSSLFEDGVEKQKNDLEIIIPPGPRLGDKVIEADSLSKGYGERLLIDDLSFKVPAGAIVGIIGPNGSGKSTLFRMITKQEGPDSGSIETGTSVKPAYVEQTRKNINPEETVWEAISGGNDTIKLGGYEMNSRAYVSRFNINGTEQQKKTGQLSGGERNRVHLAMILKQGANLLLLDEPTNDLDINTMRTLEESLHNFAGSAMIISHDRWFLDRIATHILAFEGNSTVRWFDGNFSEYLEDKRKRLGREADQPERIKYRKLTR